MRTREHNLQLLSAFANFIFPKLAADYKWPIRLNHCFLRVIYDNVMQEKWSNLLPAPAYKHMTDVEIHKCVLLCEEIRRFPEIMPGLNDISLEYRNSSQEKSHEPVPSH